MWLLPGGALIKAFIALVAKVEDVFGVFDKFGKVVRGVGGFVSGLWEKIFPPAQVNDEVDSLRTRFRLFGRGLEEVADVADEATASIADLGRQALKVDDIWANMTLTYGDNLQALRDLNDLKLDKWREQQKSLAEAAIVSSDRQIDALQRVEDAKAAVENRIAKKFAMARPPGFGDPSLAPLGGISGFFTPGEIASMAESNLDLTKLTKTTPVVVNITGNQITGELDLDRIVRRAITSAGARGAV